MLACKLRKPLAHPVLSLAGGDDDDDDDGNRLSTLLKCVLIAAHAMAANVDAHGHRANVWLEEASIVLSARELVVDRRRVYSVGMSNGGFMSIRLGCESTATFAAVASGE
jgi:predicted peptidase